MTRNNILEALCAEQIQRGTEAMQQGDDGRVGHLTSWVVVQHVLPCKVYARHLGCLVCFQGLHKQRFCCQVTCQAQIAPGALAVR